MAKQKEGETAAEETKTVVETLAVTAAKPVDPNGDGPGHYRVTLGELSGEYEAEGRNHAWAQFCDAHKTWPSPKYSLRIIERLA